MKFNKCLMSAIALLAISCNSTNGMEWDAYSLIDFSKVSQVLEDQGKDEDVTFKSYIAFDDERKRIVTAAMVINRGRSPRYSLRIQGVEGPFRNQEVNEMVYNELQRLYLKQKSKLI